MSDVEISAGGSLKVSKKVIADIISSCVKETEGVAYVASKGGIADKLAGNTNEESIKISMSGDVLAVSFGIVLKNGYNAVKTAETVQESVKNAVASMLGLTITKININIVNVVFDD